MAGRERSENDMTGAERGGEAGSLGRSHVPLRQAVTDEVRRFIVSGRFQPGERLFEENLASELAVSRNPVRESLQTLAAEGFVELEPRRGAKVARFSDQRVRELFEVREALEGLMARLAATRHTPEQLSELQAVMAAGVAGVERGDLAGLPALNTRFHALLAEMAQNTMLAEHLERLSDLIRWIYAERIQQRSADSWHEHQHIVDAIAAGDADAAARQAAHHVALARDAFLDTIRSSDGH
jgi:DNA-binding GntR family transcriptional regulator